MHQRKNTHTIFDTRKKTHLKNIPETTKKSREKNHGKKRNHRQHIYVVLPGAISVRTLASHLGCLPGAASYCPRMTGVVGGQSENGGGGGVPYNSIVQQLAPYAPVSPGERTENVVHMMCQYRKSAWGKLKPMCCDNSHPAPPKFEKKRVLKSLQVQQTRAWECTYRPQHSGRISPYFFTHTHTHTTTTQTRRKKTDPLDLVRRRH